MDDNKKYDAEISASDDVMCAKCGIALVMSPVTFSYLDHAFPVELPACEKCGMIYVPEELAKGKILHVERSLEDK
jgi:hypothetical protein